MRQRRLGRAHDGERLTQVALLERAQVVGGHEVVGLAVGPHLRRLVAVELKLEKFSPAHKGQMELYLRWLDQNDRAEGEASPIGLILCASADREQVELMDLDSANIRVAQYLHALPDVQVLQAQLHRVVQLARERQARLAPPDNKDET